MPAQLLLVNPSTPRRRLGTPRRLPSGRSAPSVLPVMRPINHKSSSVKASLQKEKKMARRSSRKASAKQIAARMRFAAMARSGAFRSRRNPSRKSRKRRGRMAMWRRNPSRQAAAIGAARRTEYLTGLASGSIAGPAYDPTKAGKGRKRKPLTARQIKARKLAKKDKKQVHALTAQIRRVTKSLAKLPKGKEKRMQRRVLRVRRSALTLKRQSLAWRKGKRVLPATLVRSMKNHGILRVNPSFSEVRKALMSSLPQVGAGAAAAVVLFKGGEMLAGYVSASSMASKLPEPVKRYLEPISTSTLSVVAFAGLKMAPASMQRFALPVLFGGMAAAAVQGLLVMRAAPAAAVVAPGTAGFGEYYGVDGVGEYVNGVGEYASVDGVGEYASVDGFGDVFSDSTLGEVEEGRDESWGEDEEDDGVLSGSIFD